MELQPTEPESQTTMLTENIQAISGSSTELEAVTNPEQPPSEDLASKSNATNISLEAEIPVIDQSLTKASEVQVAPLVEPDLHKSQPANLDSGIFEFMTPDRAIELYNKIASNQPIELEWKFYGRRAASSKVNEDTTDVNKVNNEESPVKLDLKNTTSNTEFDFDEEFGDLQSDTSMVNESLQLKKRPEPNSERKINLNDIMSDIMKEKLAQPDK